MIFLSIILMLLIVALYGYLWIISHDYSVKSIPLPRIKRILVIYPHPDDEVLTCGGILHDFVTQGIETSLLVLTKGERGIEGAELNLSLKIIREQELLQSAKALKISKLFNEDLGDGALTEHYKTARKVLLYYIDTLLPDLIITYDQSGLYGHPDHVIVSQLVTQALLQRPEIGLWYATRPEKVFKHMNLPTHMAIDTNFLRYRTFPHFRIQVSISGMMAKIKSMYTHRSQHFAFKKSRPWLPLWFYILTQTDEYFYKAQ